MGRWWGRGWSPQADVKAVSREAESDSGWRGLAPIEPTVGSFAPTAQLHGFRSTLTTAHNPRTDGTASSDVHLAWRPALRDEIDQRTCPRETTSPSRARVRPAFTAMVAKTSGPTHTGGFHTDARSACAGTVRAVRTQRRHRIWLRLRCFHQLAGPCSRPARTAGGAGGELHKRGTSDRVGPTGRLWLRLRCFHQLAGTCSRPARTAGGGRGSTRCRRHLAQPTLTGSTGDMQPTRTYSGSAGGTSTSELPATASAHPVELRLRCFHQLAGTCSRPARTAGGAGGDFHKRATSDRVGPIGRLELRLRCFHQLAGTCSRPARTAGGAGGDFHKRATSDRVGPIGRPTSCRTAGDCRADADKRNCLAPNHSRRAPNSDDFANRRRCAAAHEDRRADP